MRLCQGGERGTNFVRQKKWCKLGINGVDTCRCQTTSTIDWGEGTNTKITRTNLTHKYLTHKSQSHAHKYSPTASELQNQIKQNQKQNLTRNIKAKTTGKGKQNKKEKNKKNQNKKQKTKAKVKTKAKAETEKPQVKQSFCPLRPPSTPTTRRGQHTGVGGTQRFNSRL